MKVVERPYAYGSYLAYEEVDDELALPTDVCAAVLVNKKEPLRVLPAPFFYEKRLFFWLKARYEPGEKKTMPNGGFEVVDQAYAVRSFDLDQVILHPEVIRHQRTIDKMKRKAEKEATKRERQRLKASKRVAKEAKVKTGKRGRRALSPEEKAQREADKLAKAQRSGGKRGRPKGTTNTEPKPLKVMGTGKRGRPPLSDEAKAKKEAELIARKARSGGKRGRPKKI
jgi:hypothetical protein